ncbi:MAG TPA: class I SAM-dependent methyltransferase [Solirubrobacteraceae bacterium]|nr:class I SAM-dependent methyltransferase [Solirubrobacteraceae bacterium]
MRVLDVGCGPGDVSLLLSELVGRGGSVIGVERDGEALATARRRAVESDVSNVDFVVGDFRDVELDDVPFDALVGRLVLMYQGDPAAAVAAAARHVRPGGVVVFAEMCLRLDSAVTDRALESWPRTPAWRAGWPPRRRSTSTRSPTGCVPIPDQSGASRSGRRGRRLRDEAGVAVSRFGG